jgi:hypothetical protein
VCACVCVRARARVSVCRTLGRYDHEVDEGVVGYVTHAVGGDCAARALDVLHIGLELNN